ncbi:hypothetical protein CBS115989_6617 [Aspergillus niger]|nr:hypothetical protein CBS115989_6617 [Aspergillus niger]KAI2873896.1 hypothetical protein CBS115988_6656 [Aspergillus niger]KAI2901514.1 hypothetical protein CBS13152_1820 [Aspergillus niger]KAI2925812.1 hypothetical protein CBS147371_183 [Aspergillus niger]KAI2949134.1 hypothetical protein CBS147321_2075 [Aspergillus niger]
MDEEAARVFFSNGEFEFGYLTYHVVLAGSAFSSQAVIELSRFEVWRYYIILGLLDHRSINKWPVQSFWSLCVLYFICVVRNPIPNILASIRQLRDPFPEPLL